MHLIVDKWYLFIQQQKSLEVFRIFALISGVILQLSLRWSKWLSMNIQCNNRCVNGCQVHRTTDGPRGVQWLSNGILCNIYTPTVRPIEFKLIYRAAMKRTSSSINKHDFTALNIGKSSFPGCLYYIKSYHNIELL